MTTRISLASRSITVLTDGTASSTTNVLVDADGGDVLGLAQVLADVTHPIEIALMPPALRPRLGYSGRKPYASPGDGGVVRATDVVDAERGTSYVAECPETLLRGLLEAAERAGCVVESITSADYAWAAAGIATTDSVDSVLAIQLEGAGEIRMMAARNGRPVFWRRLPIRAETHTLVETLRSVSDHLGDRPATVPVLALGDTAFRERMVDVAHGVHPAAPVETSGLEALDYDPAAVAAAFAGTGPRFVPPEVVDRARTRTRRNGLLAAALAVICFGVAGFLDILDLRSEIDAVRAARQGIAQPVAEAMAARADLTASTAMVSTLEELRLTTPRWTAMLASLADATPPGAHLRALRAVGDSAHVDIEGQDAAAVIEALRQIPWWQGLRTASPVETEVQESGLVTERATVVGELEWEPLNGTDGRSP